jgi:ribonuclease Z
VFDAADGTLPRLHQSPLKLSNISRIFITHLHADHVLGLVSILTTIMSGIGTTPESLEKLKAEGTKKKVYTVSEAFAHS